MDRLHIDIETYNSWDIGLGVHKYVQSPDFKIQLFGVALNNDPVEVIDLDHGALIPSRVIEALIDPDVVKVAHNAAFEIVCLHMYLYRNLNKFVASNKWVEQWICTMVKCLSMGLPSKLEHAAEAIKAPHTKMDSKIMKYWCKPQKRKSKYSWDDYIAYNKADVETERYIDDFLDSNGCKVDWDLWRIDQQINFNGVPIDKKFCEDIMVIDNQKKQKDLERAKVITGLDNPNSLPKIKTWLAEEKGIVAHCLDKDAVNDYLDDKELDPEVRELFKIRKRLGNASTAKYISMLDSAIGERVYGCLAFHKARTGRWASYRIQFQNLPKWKKLKDRDVPLIKNMVSRGVDPTKIYGNTALKEMIRPAITSNTGFAVADFAAIEARVLAWLAGETWVNDVFATHGKIYEQQAVNMYKLSSIDEVTPELRSKGKTATLALGYQGAENALEQQKFDGTAVEKRDLVERYRKENPNIVNFWYYLNAIVIKCIKQGGTYNKHKIIVSRDDLWLKIQLPSGRIIRYYKPHLCKNKWGKDAMGYWGVDKGIYGHRETYGGKLAENITQAVARDCLCVVLKRLHTRGKICFHVHDEIIMENISLEKMVAAMEWPIPWAKDLVLKGAGYTSKFYKKE